IVRAFALDVTVDKGRILGISNFLRGPSTAGNTGYGIFPASFRDHLAVGPSNSVSWNVAAYTPLAVAGDNPGGTQAGLGSPGVTLEFGGLWDVATPAAVPGATGTLCALTISEQATVSVSANAARGGVVSTNPAVVLSPNFTSAVVHPPLPTLTGFSVTNGVVRVTFSWGELQTADSIPGAWTDTGNTNGLFTEPAGDSNKFYRVRGP
ncbi:MAG: hypothetical protein NT154_18500, partial [Verrucomicrobia bacterium]|nr:hypothetical protein [Verrucomicrobiota bacterium]